MFSQKKKHCFYPETVKFIDNDFCFLEYFFVMFHFSHVRYFILIEKILYYLRKKRRFPAYI